MKAICVLSLGLLILGPSAYGRSPQQQTFSARANTVRVDALVMENDRWVEGLTAADFELFDNGVKQQIDLISGQDYPLSLVLGLDTSQSVDGQRLEHLQRAGSALIDSLRSDDRLGLLTFSESIDLRLPISKDLARLKQSLGALRITNGRTGLIDAAFAGMTLADAEQERSMLLVFTDGVETTSWLGAREVLSAAKLLNVVVYAAVIDAVPTETFLDDLTATTGGRVLQVTATSDLTPTFIQVLNEFRHRYLLGFTPKDPSKGWHRLEVRVKRRGATVTARQGYQAGS